MSQSTRRLYGLRFLLIPIWMISALVLWGLTRIRILVWLALLPKGLANGAIVLFSQTGIVVLIAAAVAGSSLLLWRWLPAKPATGLAILLPLLLWIGSLSLGRINTQGTDAYVLAPAQRGDVQNTREQLVIKMAQYGLNTELQALIRAGTSVNVQNPNGQSALYWARDPEQVGCKA
jgi:uncharacterized protein